MKKSKKTSYNSKHSDYVEVSSTTDALYSDVCELGAEALEWMVDTNPIYSSSNCFAWIYQISAHPWTIVEDAEVKCCKLCIGFVDIL